MTKPVVNTQPELYKELDEQKRLEALIAKNISPKLLDYVYLFAPDIGYDIEIKNLTPKDEDLLRVYIKTIDGFNKKYGMEIRPLTDNVLEDFLLRIHDMYALRYTDARALFREYEFFRIPTQFELELSKRSMGTFETPKETNSFILPDVFIYDETGGIDWEKTKKFESSEHRIGRYISAYKNATAMRDRMFLDLETITTRGFAFVIIDRELKEIIVDVLVKVFYFFSGEVFKYINRNYMLEESVQNVFEMYRQDAEKGKAQFMKTLKPLFDEVHEVINEAFSEIKEMNKATHDMLIDDFDELLVAYFRLKLVFPRDYYAMQVRGPEEFYDSEKDQNFDVVLDFPMYIPEGGLTDIALETYFVEFSDEAKIMIFKSVTDELENPIFTLKTYLRKK